MKLIRWLLSNIVLIVIVLALSYTYVYWDNLTGEDTPAGKALAWLSEEFEQVDDIIAFLKVDGGGEPAQTAEAPVEQPAPVSQAMPETPVAEPVAEAAPVTPPPVADRYVTPEIEQSLSRLSDVDQESGAAEAKPQSTREIWIDARRSFHRRDFEGSIKGYEQLIATTTDNYDAYGELGNVYFNQGKMEKAADAYYEAAAILVRLGQLDRANSLMGMLSRMDQGKARELQDLISSSRS
jgi:tetratricopeptide (TPR) repeat protein